MSNKLRKTAIEEAGVRLSKGVQDAMTKLFGRNKVGYCLVLFEFNGPGVTYNSDARRDDMAKFFKELADRLEGREPSRIITIH